MVVLFDTEVRATINYPATTGRNFDEVFRLITSMQLTENAGLATPVNWKYGERVIVAPRVTTGDAKAKYQNFNQEELPSGRPYLRSVDCPSAGMSGQRAGGHRLSPPGPPKPFNFKEFGAS